MFYIFEVVTVKLNINLFVDGSSICAHCESNLGVGIDCENEFACRFKA